MPKTVFTMLLAVALFAQGVGLQACSKGKGTSEGQTATGAQGAAPGPGDRECYKTAGAVPCPAPPGAPTVGSDGGEASLPSAGGVCSLPTCGVCGSATSPAFKDGAGMPQPGWCICVAKSDDSGYVYSCFTLPEWQAR